MTSVIDRIKSWPRALKWALLGAIIIAAYFVAIEPAIDTYNSWKGGADVAQARLAAFERDEDVRQQERQAIELGLRQFGRVAFPGEERARSEDLNRVIEQVFSRHDVRDRTQTTRRAPLGQGPIDKSIASDQRIDRLIIDVQFDATPEQIAGVVADLEQSEVVAAVSRVQLRKAADGDRGRASGRIVRANLSVEAWLLSKRERAR